MLKLSHLYEDHLGVYEVVKLLGDGKAEIRHLTTGLKSRAMASIKLDIHNKIQECRSRGEHPRWPEPYELFFAALESSGFTLRIECHSDETAARILEELQDIDQAAALDWVHVYPEHGARARTSYAVIFRLPLRDKVPGGHSVYKHGSDRSWFGVGSKAMVYELIKRGHKPGSNGPKGGAIQ